MKALVIGHYDDNLPHEQEVRNRFMAEAPSGWECYIAQVGGTQMEQWVVTLPQTVMQAVQYAVSNDYKIIIRSYTGVYSYKPEWDYAVQNGILVAHAHGSNDYIELSSPPRLFSAITVSGGDSVVERSYGNGLEIYDQAADSSTLQSWTTASFAAKLAYLVSNNPSYNIWDVRQAARQLASAYQSGWTKYDGYGKASIGSVGSLDIAPPLDIRAQKSGDNHYVTFYWQKFLQSGFDKVRIKKSTGAVIYEGTDESFVWESDVDGDAQFEVMSVNGSGQTSRLESYCVLVVSGLSSPPPPPSSPPPPPLYIGGMTFGTKRSL